MIGESRSYGCGPHRSTTCHGARVARQRCPILRAGEGNFIHLRVEFQTLFHLDFCVMQRYPFRLDFCVMQHASRFYPCRVGAADVDQCDGLPAPAFLSADKRPELIDLRIAHARMIVAHRLRRLLDESPVSLFRHTYAQACPLFSTRVTNLTGVCRNRVRT
jgi:hypothetical protein